MAFSADIENESVEKISLAVISPRKRITGWTLANTDVYSVPFSLGYASGVWASFRNDQGFSEASGPTPSVDEFYYDKQNQILYVGALTNPDSEISLPLPGLTVQFDVYVASSFQSGFRNPRDAATEIVEWEGKLISVPLPKSGSVNDIFGFQPINVDGIKIINDGWLNEILHDVSWVNAPVSAYLLTGKDYLSAFQTAGVKQIFSGYVTAIAEQENVLTIQCTDYLKSLDREFSFDPDSLQKYSSTDFPNIDPAVAGSFDSFGKEWYIRRIYGRVDALSPVNADYNVTTPSTTNNRLWVTHNTEGESDGGIIQTIDHAAANTSTRTYFIDTPFFNEDDAIILHHTPDKYTSVGTVNRALKYIEHAPLTRTVSPGDSVERYSTGNVFILDRTGNSLPLMPGRDYVSHSFAGDVIGFRLLDNVEAIFGFFHTPFDPSQDTIMCRVYGTKDLRQYSDATDVLSVSPNTGVASRAGSLIFRLLEQSGIPVSLIDKDSFESASADSHTMGLTIPETRNAQTLRTYREMISDILASSLLRLNLINNSTSGIYIGMTAIGPFLTSGDYEISGQDFSDFSWEHDYTEIYSEIVAEYRVQDIKSFSPLTPERNAQLFVSVENKLAKHVHFITKRYEVQLLQMDEEEAQEAANRIAFILSDRRGIYRMSLPQKFIDKSSLGVSFLAKRNHLPGFPYDFDSENQRTLGVVEVQKDIESVTLTLDDQKGIQDNSGSW